MARINYKQILILIIIAITLNSCKKEEKAPDNKQAPYAKRGIYPGIYDSEGRFLILRGVNYNVLGDYWQANPSIPTTKNYSPDDIRMMAGYGFNCIRLLFSWSRLEPQRGVYDENYIQSIKTAICDAARYHIYIVLDMHQDAWGKFIATPPDSACTYPNKGWDGAPEWATLTDNFSTCTADGRRESAPAVYHSFQNFWDNTSGIQHACIAAWQHLVQATASYDNVLGYDLINEPSLGYKEPSNGETAKMGQYYDALIQAIRSAESASGMEHIIFFEQAIQWKGLEQLGMPAADFTTEENIVFAPHSYFEAFGNTPFTIEEGFSFLVFGSRNLYSSALFVGEWGFFGDPNNDVAKVKRFAKVEDANFASSTWWQWAQAPGDPHGMSWDGNNYSTTSLHLIELDQSGNFTGNVNDLYLKVLSRTRPNAIVGTPTLLTSDPDNGEMHLEATGTSQGTTEIWIPDRFGTPQITGVNCTLYELNQVSGGYIAKVTVNGNYSIIVSF